MKPYYPVWTPHASLPMYALFDHQADFGCNPVFAP